MAEQYDNKNRFVLFKNDRKTEERHPDYTGSFVDESGAEYFCDAWIKKSAKGSFMSGRVKPKKPKVEQSMYDDAAERTLNARRGSLKDQIDDDIPF
jgi:hypothetical protein